MLNKQTIHIRYSQPLDDKTIEVLKKNDKYKLFKLDFEIEFYDQYRLDMFYKILEQMPDFEISKICVYNGDNDLIDTLMEKCNFETKQDLFGVLKFMKGFRPEKSEPYEYIS